MQNMLCNIRNIRNWWTRHGGEKRVWTILSMKGLHLARKWLGGDRMAEQDVLKMVATDAAKEAVRMIKEEERKDKKKRAFQNTNLLLEHYLELKDFSNNVVYESTFAIDTENSKIYEIIDEVTDEQISVKSLKRSKEVTLIMLNHVDSALDRLYKKCKNSDNTDMLNKYEIIELLHLDPIMQELGWSDRIIQVAARLNCSERTVRRWRTEMVNKLGVYLYGVEGLNLLA